MLGSPILYLKSMRIVMFQLSGLYYIPPNPQSPSASESSKASSSVLSGHIASSYLAATQPSTLKPTVLSTSVPGDPKTSLLRVILCYTTTNGSEPTIL